VVCAKFLGELRLVLAASNRDHFEPHVARVLDREMPEAADPKDRDKVPRFGGSAPDPTKRGDPSTQ